MLPYGFSINSQTLRRLLQERKIRKICCLMRQTLILKTTKDNQCGIIGILFAIIIQMLYEQDIIVPTFLSGGEFTLREIQFVVILTWELVGVAVAAIES